MRAKVTWFTPPPTCDRIFPGAMLEKNEHGDSWSVILHATDEADVYEATYLVPDKAPPLTPGKGFIVYQGRTRTCHIEILGDSA